MLWQNGLAKAIPLPQLLATNRCATGLRSPGEASLSRPWRKLGRVPAMSEGFQAIGKGHSCGSRWFPPQRISKGAVKREEHTNRQETNLKRNHTQRN
jgi:hypothetical protein